MFTLHMYTLLKVNGGPIEWKSDSYLKPSALVVGGGGDYVALTNKVLHVHM